MHRIMFVCHGNICRSPMAEFVMKDLVVKRGLAEQFHIESAATSSEEIGNLVHAGTRKRLAKEGISCDGKRARRLTLDDYGAFDYLIGMDGANFRSMIRLYHNDPEKKTYKLLDFTNRKGDIADPWYTGDFEATYQDVLEGCEGLYQHLIETDIASL